MKTRLLLSDYIIIAMLAAIGIAAKTVIMPCAQLISSPFFIPGGVLAGGFYMLFLVLAAALLEKPGVAFLVSLLQALLVTITGTGGFHGAASIFTYTVPGLAVELVFFFGRRKGCGAVYCFEAGILANVAGSFAVNLALFNLPCIPLLLSLSVAALSGGLGGLVANLIVQRLRFIRTGSNMQTQKTENNGETRT